jgi:hypothetical protein
MWSATLFIGEAPDRYQFKLDLDRHQKVADPQQWVKTKALYLQHHKCSTCIVLLIFICFRMLTHLRSVLQERRV